jgi:hypothetical protein
LEWQRKEEKEGFCALVCADVDQLRAKSDDRVQVRQVKREITLQAKRAIKSSVANRNTFRALRLLFDFSPRAHTNRFPSRTMNAKFAQV